MYYCIWQMNVAVYQNLHVKNITKDILTLIYLFWKDYAIRRVFHARNGVKSDQKRWIARGGEK